MYQDPHNLLLLAQEESESLRDIGEAVTPKLVAYRVMLLTGNLDPFMSTNERYAWIERFKEAYILCEAVKENEARQHVGCELPANFWS